ncbi:MAG: hypothetical protein JWN52_2797 [Actinomycetia bacterium]|nr:hypothetical protein [Actinomycetes bacterium]
MTLSAKRRRRLRQLGGAMLLSLGTAVFSGAVSMVIDGQVKGGSLRWGYLAGFLIAGLLLSGGGAWLLATIRTGVGIALAATDGAGFVERYQDEAEAFLRFGAGVFTAQTALQVPVEKRSDLLQLRKSLLAGIRTLTHVEGEATTVGLLYQGRPQVGFHVGRWLNQASRRVDLYADMRDGDAVSHLRAVRLGAALRTPPRTLELALYRRENDAFTGPVPIIPAEAGGAVSDLSGTPMSLAVTLNSAVDDAGFTVPVLASALGEGAMAVVFAALPAPAGAPDSPTRELGPTTEEWESTVSALVAVAKRLPAAPGLLYLKVPAAIPVALGRFLHDGGWTPMRFDPASRSYSRFEAPR